MRGNRETYRGGTADPFLVHWPNGIPARGEVRTQYAHIIDIVPTVLDALGAEPARDDPGRDPVTDSRGELRAHVRERQRAERGTAPSTSRCWAPGHRSPRLAGRVPWPGPSFAEAGQGFGVPITAADLTDLDAHHWELYHIADDPTENHNVADQHRDRLIEMIAQWYVEAGKYDVLPIDGSGAARLMVERPQVAVPRDRYVYRPGTQTVPAWVSPRLLNRTHSITADVEIPAERGWWGW